MRYRGSSRPSKPASALAVFVGIGFIVIGITVAIPNAGAFGWFWTAIAFFITGYHVFNILSSNGVAEEVYEIASSQPAPTPSGDSETIENRIEKLASLKQKGLITETEYQTQREKIVSEI